jgi:hypothetical protein
MVSLHDQKSILVKRSWRIFLDLFVSLAGTFGVHYLVYLVTIEILYAIIGKI